MDTLEDSFPAEDPDNNLEWFDGYGSYDTTNYGRGETIAEMSGSILDRLSCQSSSTGPTNTDSMELSICKSLFSPMDIPHPTLTQFSTDSLDVSGILATCMTKRVNYTIAFEEEMESSAQSAKIKNTTQSCPNWERMVGSLAKKKVYDVKAPQLRSIEIQTSYNQEGDNGQEDAHAQGNANAQGNTAPMQKIVQSQDPVYICYPNYTLPDLNFFAHKPLVLLPQKPLQGRPISGRPTTANPSTTHARPSKPRPLSCNDIEELKQSDFTHIQDWDSLNFLLPPEYSRVLSGNEKSDEMRESSSEKVRMRRNARELKTQRLNSKFKRFSLQDLPEMREMAEEIERNLETFDDFLGGEQSWAKSRTRVAHVTPMQCSNRSSRNLVELGEKQWLTDEISSAIHQINNSKTRVIFSESPTGKLIIDSLCPALYNLLSDGLTPCLDTIFGKVPNTVWRVVEASIQYGPTAQTLNELVMKINSEDSLAEGPIKFNAFVCGLLNLSSLSSWLTFLRTKERLLRTHYAQDSFMFLCNTLTRLTYDQMLTQLKFNLHFQLDIFAQVKSLHLSLAQSRQKSAPPKTKTSKLHANEKKKSNLMKRSYSDERPKSGKAQIIPKSKTAQNLNKVKKRPETLVENNFKQLQMQWELMASDERKRFPSKIPRPITSPVKAVKKF